MCLADYSLPQQLRLNDIFTKGQKTFCYWSSNHWFERGQRQAPGSSTAVQTSWEVLAVLGEGNPKAALPHCQLPLQQQEVLKAAGWVPGGTCLGVPCSVGRHLCQGSLGLPRQTMHTFLPLYWQFWDLQPHPALCAFQTHLCLCYFSHKHTVIIKPRKCSRNHLCWHPALCFTNAWKQNF